MSWQTTDIPSEILGALASAGLPVDPVLSLVMTALEEDLAGSVDVTSVATVPAEQRSVMDLVARRPGVVAGLPVAQVVFEVVSRGDVETEVVAADGTAVAAGTVLLTARGRTRDLLVAERTSLNILCHLSGVATETARWVERIAGTGARVRDTRKTTPGMRELEKYAVRCGGGVNHRMSLSDAALVKDNHVVAAGGVAEAFGLVRQTFPGLDVEVEVDSLAQLDEAVAAGADLVLLDNFSVAQTAEAVARVDGRCRLESSGGLSLDEAKAYAETGVDYLAVGALTHSAPILDIGADLRPLTD